MDKSYKARKEHFVSNLSGGSLSEIILITLVAPAAVLLWSALQARKSFFIPYRLVAFLTDFLLNVGGILSAITIYSSAPLLLDVLLISPAILVAFTAKQHGQKKARTPPSRDSTPSATSPAVTTQMPVRPFLTTYRGAMMIVTCLAILAVDFRIFPRRFAKVENWGTSLMDMGVGSFVFSAGVVSARAIAAKSTKQPLIQRLLIATRHSIPLCVLGLIRLYSVKGLDYAEHVTEYGVHWNFFFTLAFLPPFVEIFHSITVAIPSYDALAVILAVAYEIVLDNTDLKAYILVSPRGESLLSKNREGIFSFLGYLAIFLAGRGTGLVVIPEHTSSSTDSSKSAINKTAKSRRHALISSLLLRSVLWWLLYSISTLPHLYIPPTPNSWVDKGFPILDLGLGLGVSRRLANLPYVLWVTAFNSSQILLFCLIETYFFPSVAADNPSKQTSEEAAAATAATKATPRIMRAFNKNGLIIFLVANLLTGAVNLLFPTLDMGPATSMAVMIAYAAVLTGFAVGLDTAGVKIKL